MPPWSAPDHLQKPPRPGEPVRTPGAALAPVWVEADELRAFKAWWNRLSDGERNARSAFLHGLQQGDVRGAIYQKQGEELQHARESLRLVEKKLVEIRAANRDFAGNSTRRPIARATPKSA